MKQWLLPLALLPAGLAAAEFRADFEGGSIGKVEKLSANHFRLAVKGETDQDGRNRQATWYYFRVDGAPRSEVLIDLIALPGEYNYKPNQGAISDKTPPVISYDQKTWEHVTSCEYDSKEPRLRLRIVPKAPRFWVAHTPPYTHEHLSKLRRIFLRHRDAQEQVIGKTVDGRPLYLWTIAAESPKKTVWLMFRQHSWESGSSWVAEGATRALLSADTRSLREKVNWKIFPMCDPDGVARGGVRFNRNAYDLNRNWDVNSPQLMPEITAQRKAVAKWLHSGRTIDLFLSLHNTETAEYLEGPPGGDADSQIRSLAELFFDTLRRRTMFEPTRPLFFSATTTTEGRSGRMTVVQGLHRDFRIPAFLMEQRITVHPKLARPPNVADRIKFGEQLIEAIATALGLN